MEQSYFCPSAIHDEGWDPGPLVGTLIMCPLFQIQGGLIDGPLMLKLIDAYDLNPNTELKAYLQILQVIHYCCSHSILVTALAHTSQAPDGR